MSIFIVKKTFAVEVTRTVLAGDDKLAESMINKSFKDSVTEVLLNKNFIVTEPEGMDCDVVDLDTVFR